MMPFAVMRLKNVSASAWAELLTNGNFATNDFTGWTTSGGWSASSGQASISSGVFGDYIQQVTPSLVSGSTYRFSVRAVSGAFMTHKILGGSDVFSNNGDGAVHYRDFTPASSGTVTVQSIYNDSDGLAAVVDDWSVIQIA